MYTGRGRGVAIAATAGTTNSFRGKGSAFEVVDRGLMAIPRITATAGLLLVMATALQTVGCGRKGPLYLPEPQPEPTETQQKQQEQEDKRPD